MEGDSHEKYCEDFFKRLFDKGENGLMAAHDEHVSAYNKYVDSITPIVVYPDEIERMYVRNPMEAAISANRSRAYIGSTF